MAGSGLPEGLRSGLENLSGISLGNVRVHYNSLAPVQQGALAFSQGSDIHLAPGQERHLPHEAWHVVQQRAGALLPAVVPMNDGALLEGEADRIAVRAQNLCDGSVRNLADGSVRNLDGDGSV